MGLTNKHKLYEALDLNAVGMEQVKLAMETGGSDAMAEAVVKHFKTRTKPLYFYDALDKSKQLDVVLKDSEYSDGIVKEADRIIGDSPMMFGFTVDFSNPLIWDFAAYGTNSFYGCHMNRFLWMIPVGQAYWITGDEKYAVFFTKIIKQWIEENPLKLKQLLVRGQGEGGFPWNNSLDIGVRLKSFVQLFAYFRCYEGWETDEYIDFLKSISDHCKVLYPQQGNLFGSNWQTQECEGLAHAAIMFPEFLGSFDWYDVTLLRFSQHASPLLTKPDGTYHEPTPGYFAWTRDHIFSFMSLSELNDYKVDANLRDSLERMYVWFMKMTMQDGSLPRPGDTSLYDDRHSMALGAALFLRGDLKFVSGFDELPTEHIWMVSRKQFDDFANLEAVKPKDSHTYLQDCQYLILRDDWSKLGNGNCIFLDVNPVAHGHNHFDYLNIEAVFDGERLITESGHLGYIHMFRLKYVIGAIGHNILMIDDGAMQESWLENPLPCVCTHYFSDEYDYIEGKVSYPATDTEQISWRRLVLYLKPDLFVMVDTVTGDCEHKFKRLFHVGDGCDIQLFSEKRTVKIIGERSSCFVTYMDEPDISVSTDDGLEEFNGKLGVFVIEHSAKLPMQTITSIANARDGSIPKVERQNNRLAVSYGEKEWLVTLKDMGGFTDVKVEIKRN